MIFKNADLFRAACRSDTARRRVSELVKLELISPYLMFVYLTFQGRLAARIIEKWWHWWQVEQFPPAMSLGKSIPNHEMFFWKMFLKNESKSFLKQNCLLHMSFEKRLPNMKNETYVITPYKINTHYRKTNQHYQPSTGPPVYLFLFGGIIHYPVNDKIASFFVPFYW